MGPSQTDEAINQIDIFRTKWERVLHGEISKLSTQWHFVNDIFEMSKRLKNTEQLLIHLSQMQSHVSNGKEDQRP